LPSASPAATNETGDIALAKMVIQWFPGKPAALVPTEVAEIGEASAEAGMVMLPVWKGDTEWKEATP